MWKLLNSNIVEITLYCIVYELLAKLYFSSFNFTFPNAYFLYLIYMKIYKV